MFVCRLCRRKTRKSEQQITIVDTRWKYIVNYSILPFFFVTFTHFFHTSSHCCKPFLTKSIYSIVRSAPFPWTTNTHTRRVRHKALAHTTHTNVTRTRMRAHKRFRFRSACMPCGHLSDKCLHFRFSYPHSACSFAAHIRTYIRYRGYHA